MNDVLEFKSVQNGMQISNAVAYIASYRSAARKSGDEFYIIGTFKNKGETLGFKVWEKPLVTALMQNSLEGRVVRISGKASVYNNVLEVSLTAIQPVDDSAYPISLFLKSANVNSLFEEFKNFVSTELSENAQKLLSFIFGNEKIYDRFKEEFAGSRMHDAQIGGLLNHTLKMLRIAKVVYENDSRFGNQPNYKDLLYLSIILHDVGKIWEMNYGVYQKNSYVTHRILGIELLVKYKNAILQVYDDGFYYQLVAVLQGHHGEFEDAPKTVLAYIVHLIDMLESQTTGIFDKIENNEVESRAGWYAVRVDGKYLMY